MTDKKYEYFNRDRVSQEDLDALTLYVWFNSPLVRIEEEFYLVNIFGLVGTIGGALGIFIGLSGLDIVHFLDTVSHRLKK